MSEFLCFRSRFVEQERARWGSLGCRLALMTVMLLTMVVSSQAKPPTEVLPEPSESEPPGTQGEEATTPPTPIPDPIVPMPDPDAEQKIFDALHGKTPNAPPGVLSDVLDVIRSQGSVLDGSSLDASSDDPLGIDIAEKHANRRGHHPDVNQTTQTRSAFVQTAESLLKTSRMLEKLVPLMRASEDETKRTPAADSSLNFTEQPHRSEQTQAVNELIYRMRLQATRLLLQQYPEATER